MELSDTQAVYFRSKVGKSNPWTDLCLMKNQSHMSNKEKFAANIQRMRELESRTNEDWQSKYYRAMNQEFYTSSSYSAPSAKVEGSSTPIGIATVLKRAKKVRHNPAPAKVYAKYVVINGIPHKRTENGYVALTPAKSK